MATLEFFRERLRVQLHQLLLREFLRQEQAARFTRKALADRIGKRAEQITRWLSAPNNWTLDTLSDLLLGMGAEPACTLRRVGEQPADVPAAADHTSDLVAPKPTATATFTFDTGRSGVGTGSLLISTIAAGLAGGITGGWLMTLRGQTGEAMPQEHAEEAVSDVRSGEGLRGPIHRPLQVQQPAKCMDVQQLVA